MTSSQETERVHSYNPGAHTGLHHTNMHTAYWLVTTARRLPAHIYHSNSTRAIIAQSECRDRWSRRHKKITITPASLDSRSQSVPSVVILARSTSTPVYLHDRITERVCIRTLCSSAGPTVHQHRLFQVCFPIFSTVCLEIAAMNSSDQRLSVCF